MKSLQIVLTILALQSAAIAAEVAAPVEKQARTSTEEISQEALDRFVRDYVKAVRSAESVDKLTEFIPASRMRKLMEKCTPKERADWLQFRRMMPPIANLLKVTEKKNLAVLIYSCQEKQSSSSSNKKPEVAKITLVREDGKWKISKEHFAPSDIILPNAQKP